MYIGMAGWIKQTNKIDLSYRPTLHIYILQGLSTRSDIGNVIGLAWTATDLAM